jgi:hypothetical protein
VGGRGDRGRRLDEQAVDAHADSVAAEAGSIDVSLNVITRGDVQGTPLVEMATADFVRPITTGMTTNSSLPGQQPVA